jgi:hypothetical protein
VYALLTGGAGIGDAPDIGIELLRLDYSVSKLRTAQGQINLVTLPGFDAYTPTAWHLNEDHATGVIPQTRHLGAQCCLHVTPEIVQCPLVGDVTLERVAIQGALTGVGRIGYNARPLNPPHLTA